MTHTTDPPSADDPARPDLWWAALLADLSPTDEARLRRMAEAFVGASAEDDTPAPGLLDLEDAANAARSLANGLLLAIEGLGPGDEREAPGRSTGGARIASRAEELARDHGD